MSTHDDLPYPAGHPFDGMEGLIESNRCLGCDGIFPWNYLFYRRGLCSECLAEEEAEEADRNRSQTLADVGMCEADFR